MAELLTKVFRIHGHYDEDKTIETVNCVKYCLKKPASFAITYSIAFSTLLFHKNNKDL
jgi:hypothetical protein